MSGNGNREDEIEAVISRVLPRADHRDSDRAADLRVGLIRAAARALIMDSGGAVLADLKRDATSAPRANERTNAKRLLADIAGVVGPERQEEAAQVMGVIVLPSLDHLPRSGGSNGAGMSTPAQHGAAPAGTNKGVIALPPLSPESES